MSAAETPPQGPVFVAGCGRSGTSFVRTVLDAHPDVYIPSETLCLVDYLRHWDDLPARLRTWLFFHEPQVRCWYGGPVRDGASAAEVIARVHQYEAERHDARVWGQKTPRFVRDMPLFEEAFPDIRWVLLHRDPRAVVASMLASGQHTNSVDRAIARWKHDNAPIVAYLQAGQPVPDNVLLLRYEDVVQDFEGTLERLWDFLQLPSVDRETILARARPVFFSRSRFPINTIREGMEPNPRVLDSWRSKLQPSQVAAIERACAAEMAVMGYPPSGASAGPRPATTRARETLREARILARYAWYWPEYPIFVALRTAVLAVAGPLSRVRRRPS